MSTVASLLPDEHPAVLLDPDLRVAKANARWHALHLPFEERDNVAEMVFLDRGAAGFFADRNHEEHDVVAALREAVRSPSSRAAAEATADHLIDRSARFAALWSGLPVRLRLVDSYVVRHPELGTLAFDRRTARLGAQLLRVAVPRPRTAPLLPLLDHLVEPREPGCATAR